MLPNKTIKQPNSHELEMTPPFPCFRKVEMVFSWPDWRLQFYPWNDPCISLEITLVYCRKEAGVTCRCCDKESLNEHCCCGEVLSKRSALFLGLNSICPSFWQMFPVGIEVLKLKIPGTQQCLVRICHFLNTFIPVEQTAISRARKGRQMPGSCKAGRLGA